MEKMRSFEGTREKLLTKLDELQKRQGRLDRDLRRLVHPDSGERALEAENDEVLEDLDAHTHAEIGQIRAALARIEAGGYGKCGGCGEDIPEARLEALPFADRCIDCAS
jgi:RNA polymerase-binding transcription factor DksA